MGVPFPHVNDGSVFMNREGLLPEQPVGYYREYVHPTAGIDGPGRQRLVIGGGGETYYTPDHYKSFIRIR
jgi:filamentous hemagglutinin